jgi:ABC-type nitrate/sulfonate/bicarbonate transport system permease component
MAHNAKYICVPPTGYWKYALPIIGLASFVMFWQVVTDMGLFNPNFLPSPGVAWDAFVALFSEVPKQIAVGDGTFRKPEGWWDEFTHTPAMLHGMASVERIAASVWYACLVGLPVGILMGAFGAFEGFCKALVEPMRNAPIIAFLPLFMLIWGVEEQMKVGFLTFGTVVYIIPATFDAVRNVPHAIVDKAVDHGFRPLGTLWHYVLPAALPRIYDGVRLCTGIAWTYLVAAEIMNVTTGLGAVIQNARRLQNTPKVYAAIILILILGVLTDLAFRAIKRLVPMLQQEKAA